MTIKITTPNGGSDSLDFGCAQTAIVATVTGTEVSSGEGKLELKTTTGGTSAAKMTIAANGTVTLATPLPVASGGTGGTVAVGIQEQTAQATTSGTSKDFTGIPSGVNRISVILGGIRSNGTSDILIQLGTGGSLVTSGYKAGWHRNWSGSGNNGTSTSGFPYSFDQTGQIDYGIVTFARLTGNTWVESGTLGCQDTTILNITGWGIIALAGEVDQLRFTTANGSDVFDLGTVNISWEF